jgi:uncharacterized PurR-regulated membrane protein YhhQ (DUF165 family)
MRKPIAAGILFTAFAGTVIAANWALNRYGIVGVGFGLTAPAGVYFAGLAFGLRDALHEAGGHRLVILAIVVGGLVSYWIGDGVRIPGGNVSIALASAVAFTISELADFAVYAPLRKRHPWKAVVASNVVGSIADSALFLWLAFGSLDHIAGQVVAKTYMITVALPIVAIVRRRRAVPRHTLHPAGA